MTRTAVTTLGLAVGACLAGMVGKTAGQAGGGNEGPIVLSVGRIEQIRADQYSEFTVTLYLDNVGQEPVYLSPVPGELAGTLEILANPKGSRARPGRLYSRSRPYSGYAFEDLFKLMPGRRLRYSLVVRYRPPFVGEGTIELRARYDPREMAKGDPRAFAAPLEAEPVEIPVRKANVKKY